MGEGADADNVDRAAVLGGGLAATISLVVGEGPWSLIMLPIGLVLAIVVFAFTGHRSGWDRPRQLAWAGVVALCGAVAAGPVLQLAFNHVDVLQTPAMEYSSWWQDSCDSSAETADCVAYTATDALVLVWLLLAGLSYGLLRSQARRKANATPARRTEKAHQRSSDTHDARRPAADSQNTLPTDGLAN